MAFCRFIYKNLMIVLLVMPCVACGVKNAQEEGNGKRATLKYANAQEEQVIVLDEDDGNQQLPIIEEQAVTIAALHKKSASDQKQIQELNLKLSEAAKNTRPAASTWEKNKDLGCGMGLGLCMVTIFFLSDHIWGKKLGAKSYALMGKKLAQGKAFGARVCTAGRARVAQKVTQSKEMCARAWAVVCAKFAQSKALGVQAYTALREKMNALIERLRKQHPAPVTARK